MSSNYKQARRGRYWDKSSAITTTRGSYVLPEDESLDFGYPVQLDGTGYIDDIFNKRKVKAYPTDLGAGSGQILGCGVKVYEDVSSYSTSQLALHGRKYKARDITILLIGAIQLVNQGSTAVEAGDTIIPVDDGFEKMTDADQYSLGKALEPIPAGGKGLVWVNPDYEKPTI